jgi:hypothetical protein
MEAEVTAAAAETSNRRRLMFNGKSGLAMMPSCERRAGASATFCRFLGHIPVFGGHRACGSRLARAPALILMRAGEYRPVRRAATSLRTLTAVVLYAINDRQVELVLEADPWKSERRKNSRGYRR